MLAFTQIICCWPGLCNFAVWRMSAFFNVYIWCCWFCLFLSFLYAVVKVIVLFYFWLADAFEVFFSVIGFFYCFGYLCYTVFVSRNIWISHTTQIFTPCVLGYKGERWCFLFECWTIKILLGWCLALVIMVFSMVSFVQWDNLSLSLCKWQASLFPTQTM